MLQVGEGVRECARRLPQCACLKHWMLPLMKNSRGRTVHRDLSLHALVTTRKNELVEKMMEEAIR
jgi:hypothetical protein